MKSLARCVMVSPAESCCTAAKVASSGEVAGALAAAPAWLGARGLVTFPRLGEGGAGCGACGASRRITNAARKKRMPMVRFFLSMKKGGMMKSRISAWRSEVDGVLRSSHQRTKEERLDAKTL